MIQLHTHTHTHLIWDIGASLNYHKLESYCFKGEKDCTWLQQQGKFYYCYLNDSTISTMQESNGQYYTKVWRSQKVSLAQS